MAISKEKLTTFVSVWRIKFVDKLLSGANGAALVITFLGYFGLTFSNVPYAHWTLSLIPLAVGWAGIRSLPKFRIMPNEVVGKKIELEELETFLVRVPRVGLLGVHEVGKTTFLNAVLHHTEPKRRTAKPYAVIVQFPQAGKAMFAAIIDSVGERYENQIQVMNTTDVACLFLDHNASATLSNRSTDRIKDEQRFVDQLVLSRREARAGADRVIIVENKSDLWKDDPKVVNAMARLTDYVITRMTTIVRPAGLQSLRGFSNIRSEDVTRLLSEIKNAIAG